MPGSAFMLPVACASAVMIKDAACDLLRGILFPGVREKMRFAFHLIFPQFLKNLFLTRSQGEKKIR